MARYLRNPDIEAAPMQDETVLYDPAGNRFCVLNPSAARLWECLAQPATLEDLATKLRDGFAVGDGADVEGDVKNTLRQLQDLNIVRPADA